MDEQQVKRIISDGIIHAKSAIPEESRQAFNDAAEAIAAAAREWAEAEYSRGREDGMIAEREVHFG